MQLTASELCVVEDQQNGMSGVGLFRDFSVGIPFIKSDNHVKRVKPPSCSCKKTINCLATRHVNSIFLEGAIISRATKSSSGELFNLQGPMDTPIDS